MRKRTFLKHHFYCCIGLSRLQRQTWPDNLFYYKVFIYFYFLIRRVFSVYAYNSEQVYLYEILASGFVFPKSTWFSSESIVVKYEGRLKDTLCVLVYMLKRQKPFFLYPFQGHFSYIATHFCQCLTVFRLNNLNPLVGLIILFGRLLDRFTQRTMVTFDRHDRILSVTEWSLNMQFEMDNSYRKIILSKFCSKALQEN